MRVLSEAKSVMVKDEMLLMNAKLEVVSKRMKLRMTEAVKKDSRILMFSLFSTLSQAAEQAVFAPV